jgi:hypothetical protein
LLKTLTELQKCPVKIWIMQDVPNFSWNVPRALARAALFHNDPEKLNLPLNSYFEQVADQEHEFKKAAASDISILNPAQYLSKGAIVPLSEDGFPIYQDVHHLTIHGAMLLRPMFLPLFTPLEKRAAGETGRRIGDGRIGVQRSCQCQLPVASCQLPVASCQVWTNKRRQLD